MVHGLVRQRTVRWNLSRNAIAIDNHLRRYRTKTWAVDYRNKSDLQGFVLHRLNIRSTSLENNEMMNRSPQYNRPSRFRVPNNERVMLLVGTDLVSGTLRLLSMTGGTVRVPKRRSPGTFGEIRISTISGSITAVVELLSAIGDSVQAFRFVQIEPASKKRLQESLQQMKAQGLGDGRQDRLQGVLSFARRLLPRSMAI